MRPSAADAARQKGGSAADVKANVAEAEKQVEEAKKHCEHAIRISPSDKRPYLSLADLYKREKKLDLAAATLAPDWRKWARTTSILTSVWRTRCWSQGKLDEADKTIGGLEQTVQRIAPASAAAHQAGVEANGRFAARPMVGVKGAIS